MRNIRLSKLIKSVIFSGILILSTTIFAALPQGKYLAFAEVMPKPIGGIESIYKNIISYPKVAKNAGIEGKVYVLAFINEKGTVDKVKIVKGLGGGCDEAAIRAVSQTQFTPAKSKGEAVKVKTSLAIVFKIQK